MTLCSGNSGAQRRTAVCATRDLRLNSNHSLAILSDLNAFSMRSHMQTCDWQYDW